MADLSVSISTLRHYFLERTRSSQADVISVRDVRYQPPRPCANNTGFPFWYSPAQHKRQPVSPYDLFPRLSERIPTLIPTTLTGFHSSPHFQRLVKEPDPVKMCVCAREHIRTCAPVHIIDC